MKLPLDAPDRRFGIPQPQAALKRGFDLLLGVLLCPVVLPLFLVFSLGARFSTGESGIFAQQRIGLYGEPFTLYKIRSMRPSTVVTTNVTTSDDPRITRYGRFLRKTKMDELPQLWNVLRGDMSFVGPRPDVAEVYEDCGDDAKKVLCVRPGITGPASVAFKDEERQLLNAADPEAYNRDVIFPAKIAANLRYIRSYSPLTDLGILWRTVFG